MLKDGQNKTIKYNKKRTHVKITPGAAKSVKFGIRSP